MSRSIRLVEPVSRMADVLPRWVAPAAVGVVALAGTAVVGVLDPEVRGHLTPGCPFRTLTSLDCPGCGGTRALYALTQGDPGLAVQHNILTVVALPLLALAWVVWFAYRLGLRDRPAVVSPSVAYGILTVFVAFFVLRNLPWFPFTWLGSGAG
jgi:hypothetical protein